MQSKLTIAETHNWKAIYLEMIFFLVETATDVTKLIFWNKFIQVLLPRTATYNSADTFEMPQ